MAAGEGLDWNAMALVGRIARPHGLRGEVLVNPETDFVEERFQPGAVLFISRAGSLDAIRIDASRVHLGRPLVKIAGVEILVPLAEEICVAVDLSARLILVRPPEGLLALNEPERRRRRS
jgi:ribosomal 30S subunit maturation factor RimM